MKNQNVSNLQLKANAATYLRNSAKTVEAEEKAYSRQEYQWAKEVIENMTAETQARFLEINVKLDEREARKKVCKTLQINAGLGANQFFAFIVKGGGKVVNTVGFNTEWEEKGEDLQQKAVLLRVSQLMAEEDEVADSLAKEVEGITSTILSEVTADLNEAALRTDIGMTYFLGNDGQPLSPKNRKVILDAYIDDLKKQAKEKGVHLVFGNPKNWANTYAKNKAAHDKKYGKAGDKPVETEMDRLSRLVNKTHK